jgi:hypothetical protein
MLIECPVCKGVMTYPSSLTEGDEPTWICEFPECNRILYTEKALDRLAEAVESLQVQLFRAFGSRV